MRVTSITSVQNRPRRKRRHRRAAPGDCCPARAIARPEEPGSRVVWPVDGPGVGPMAPPLAPRFRAVAPSSRPLMGLPHPVAQPPWFGDSARVAVTNYDCKVTAP